MPPPLTLLRNATVYAPAALGNVDVLLGGGRILAIGADLPAGMTTDLAETIDCTGKTLIPGLVDAHTHLTGGGGEGGAHTKVPPVQLSALTMAGVTTAIGLLGTDCRTRSIAELLAAARGLEYYGITTFCYTGGYEVPPVTLTGSARGDIVNVDRIVAMGEIAISDPRSSQPTFDELARLAADAHVAGMMTGKAGILHLHLGDGPRGLDLVRRILAETEIPPRVFHPTHCNRNRPLWEEAVALSALGCTIDITAFPPDESDPGLTAANAIVDWHARGLPAYQLTVSSDGGGCLPTFDADGTLRAMDVGSAAMLLTTLHEANVRGVPFEYALATMTSNVATLFRLHRKGEIAPGKDADVVLLDANRVVDTVYANGVGLVLAGVPTRLGMFEPA